METLSREDRRKQFVAKREQRKQVANYIKRNVSIKLASAAISTPDSTVFDDAKMTADAVLSTITVDRDGEIMLPQGCDLTDYQQGPAPWFFNHQQCPYPIGSAKERALEKDCPISVFVAPEKITGRCWFNQATKEAETVYHLWRIGHLGAVSVGFEGITSEPINGEEALKLSGGTRTFINKWVNWKMVENSVVGIGANKEALAMHAARGIIGKSAIPESMKPFFAQFLVKPKFFRSGFTSQRQDVQSVERGSKTFGKGWGK